jgi:hypothetical protein
MNSIDNNHDDLTVIKGIGRPDKNGLMCRWVFLISKILQSYQQTKLNQLKADNQIVSRTTIEAWIAEAQKRANPGANLQRSKLRMIQRKQSSLSTIPRKKNISTPDGQIKGNDDDGEGRPQPEKMAGNHSPRLS